MAQAKRGKQRGKKIPSRRKKPDPKKKPCQVTRIGLIVGAPANNDLNAAENWIIQRAGALGGSFRLWRSRSASPLDKVQDSDISGGVLPLQFTEHSEKGTGNAGYGGLLPESARCRGRIEELVIFHHGSNVNERDLGAQLVKILETIRVPVCRIVWWACNAEVALKIDLNEWTAVMMRQLSRIANCAPCGCAQPIELVWPTAGKCYLTGPAANDVLQTNDGQVNVARWGHRWSDGSLHVDFPPGVSTVSSDRDPPYNQPVPPQNGNVLGVPVGRKP